MKKLNRFKSLKNVELLNEAQLTKIKGGDGDKPEDTDIFNDMGGTITFGEGTPSFAGDRP